MSLLNGVSAALSLASMMGLSSADVELTPQQKQGLDVHTATDQLCLDPISSFAGFAIVGAGSLKDVKMKKLVGRFKPLTPEEATEESLKWQSVINAAALPRMLQNLFQARDRQNNGDSREKLEYYNSAFPFVKDLFPLDSENQEQNKSMRSFWNYVQLGIELCVQGYESASSNSLNSSLPLEEMAKDPSFLLRKLKKEINAYLASAPQGGFFHASSSSMAPQPVEAKASASIQAAAAAEEEEESNATLQDLLALVQDFDAEKASNKDVKAKLKELIAQIGTIQPEAAPSLSALSLGTPATRSHANSLDGQFKHRFPQSMVVKKVWDVAHLIIVVKHLDEIRDLSLSERKLKISVLNKYLDDKVTAYIAAVKPMITDLIWTKM